MPDVNTGVIDLFLHPPLGVLNTHLDYYGPYSNEQTLTRWSSTPGPVFTNVAVSESYGVLARLNGSIPPGLGAIDGWTSPDGQDDEAMYEVRLLQIAVQHQLLSGAWVTSQLVNVTTLKRLILWDTALPGRIGLLAAPGIAFDLFYLLVN